MDTIDKLLKGELRRIKLESKLKNSISLKTLYYYRFIKSLLNREIPSIFSFYDGEDIEIQIRGE